MSTPSWRIEMQVRKKNPPIDLKTLDEKTREEEVRKREANAERVKKYRAKKKQLIAQGAAPQDKVRLNVYQRNYMRERRARLNSKLEVAESSNETAKTAIVDGSEDSELEEKTSYEKLEPADAQIDPQFEIETERDQEMLVDVPTTSSFDADAVSSVKSTMPESTPTIIRDLDFFLEPIFIRVEDAMFQIPKHYVTHFSIFSESTPRKNGITEKNPLILHQVSKVDFKAFLRVLVPLQVPPNYSNIIVDEWISTLKLSTMWEITGLRDLAIRNLTQLDVVNMILLGSKYRVSKWFIDGCTKLIMRSHGPTEEEGHLLGIGFIVHIYELRERMLSLRMKGSYFDCQHVVRATFPDKIFD